MFRRSLYLTFNNLRNTLNYNVNLKNKIFSKNYNNSFIQANNLYLSNRYFSSNNNENNNENNIENNSDDKTKLKLVFNVLSYSKDIDSCKFQLYIKDNKDNKHKVLKDEYYDKTIFTGNLYIDGSVYYKLILSNDFTNKNILSDYSLKNNLTLSDISDFARKSFIKFIYEEGKNNSKKVLLILLLFFVFNLGK